MAEYLKVGRHAALAGGAVLQDWAGRFAVTEKGPADLVTEADFASQETVRKIIMDAFPDHGFLAEENGMSTVGKEGYRWIVDPLDGTTNYVHGLAQYCVSIGLECRGKLLAGIVFDPMAGDCFTAALGQGAFLNDKPLRVSAVKSLSKALVAVSFPPGVGRGDPSVDDFLNVMDHAQAIRRMGSSALNLCYVAAGRIDGYWAKDTKAWDVAAGYLLVTEAGGILTSYDGGPADVTKPRFVAASTPELHRELSDLLHRRAKS
ncbi:MAG: inositol monophosphatase [Planctomycetia bacterium]|nr:inositol monophosphatase [Planctomycetia bacterium]